jgi:hypothetical protein
MLLLPFVGRIGGYPVGGREGRDAAKTAPTAGGERLPPELG